MDGFKNENCQLNGERGAKSPGRNRAMKGVQGPNHLTGGANRGRATLSVLAISLAPCSECWRALRIGGQ
jgi:hypothetical protein